MLSLLHVLTWALRAIVNSTRSMSQYYWTPKLQASYAYPSFKIIVYYPNSKCRMQTIDVIMSVLYLIVNLQNVLYHLRSRIILAL